MAHAAIQVHIYQDGRILPDDINMLEGTCINKYLEASVNV
jgi:hypothetical protein